MQQGVPIQFYECVMPEWHGYLQNQCDEWMLNAPSAALWTRNKALRDHVNGAYATAQGRAVSDYNQCVDGKFAQQPEPQVGLTVSVAHKLVGEASGAVAQPSGYRSAVNVSFTGGTANGCALLDWRMFYKLRLDYAQIGHSVRVDGERNTLYSVTAQNQFPEPPGGAFVAMNGSWITSGNGYFEAFATWKKGTLTTRKAFSLWFTPIPETQALVPQERINTANIPESVGMTLGTNIVGQFGARIAHAIEYTDASGATSSTGVQRHGFTATFSGSDLSASITMEQQFVDLIYGNPGYEPGIELAANDTSRVASGNYSVRWLFLGYEFSYVCTPNQSPWNNNTPYSNVHVVNFASLQSIAYAPGFATGIVSEEVSWSVVNVWERANAIVEVLEVQQVWGFADVVKLRIRNPTAVSVKVALTIRTKYSSSSNTGTGLSYIRSLPPFSAVVVQLVRDMTPAVSVPAGSENKPVPMTSYLLQSSVSFGADGIQSPAIEYPQFDPYQHTLPFTGSYGNRQVFYPGAQRFADALIFEQFPTTEEANAYIVCATNYPTELWDTILFIGSGYGALRVFTVTETKVSDGTTRNFDWTAYETVANFVSRFGRYHTVMQSSLRSIRNAGDPTSPQKVAVDTLQVSAASLDARFEELMQIGFPDNANFTYTWVPKSPSLLRPTPIVKEYENGTRDIMVDGIECEVI